MQRKKLGIYFHSKLCNLKQRTTTQQTAKRHWWSDYSEQNDFYRGWLIHEKKNTRATKNETNLYTRLMDSFGDSDMQLTTNITSMPSIIISSSDRISIFQSESHSYHFLVTKNIKAYTYNITPLIFTKYEKIYINFIWLICLTSRK